MSTADIPFSDREVAAYIDELPRCLTYSEIRTACLRRFGERRAWSEAAIAEYWMTRSPKRRRQLSQFDRDPELAAFVEDRLDRLTLDELVGTCGDRFGADRAPSRSALHRHAVRRRAELRRQRSQPSIEEASNGH